MFRRFHMILVLAGCMLVPGTLPLVAAPTTAPAADALLSTDDITKLVDAGQYKDALRAIAKVLQLSGPAAGPYNRHEILMLRAECQLQTHVSAMETLELAKKESLVANKPEDLLQTMGLIELIQKSPGGVYTPKTAAIKTPIKILDRSTRREAYEALFADELAMFQAKANAVNGGKSLPPFLEAAKMAMAMRSVEWAATGSNKQTDEAVKDLATHALKLINSVVADASSRTDRINTAANRIITETVMVNGPNGTPYPGTQSRRQGLQGNDTKDLQEVYDTCGKLVPFTEQFAKSFPRQADDFRAAGSKSEDVQRKAKSTLKANYADVQ